MTPVGKTAVFWHLRKTVLRGKQLILFRELHSTFPGGAKKKIGILGKQN